MTVPLATHCHSPLPPPHIPLHVIIVQRFGWHPTQSFSPSQLQTTQQAYGMWKQGIFWWSTLDTVGQWTPLHFIQLSTMPAPRLVIPRPIYGGVQWTPPPYRDKGAPVTLLLRRQWAVSWYDTRSQFICCSVENVEWKEGKMFSWSCNQEYCVSSLKDLAAVTQPTISLLPSSLLIRIDKTVFFLHLSNPNKTHLVKTGTYQTKIRQTLWKCLWWKRLSWYCVHTRVSAGRILYTR